MATTISRDAVVAAGAIVTIKPNPTVADVARVAEDQDIPVPELFAAVQDLMPPRGK